MARRQVRGPGTAEQTLSPVPFCWACRQPTRVAYHSERWITHLWGRCHYTLVVRCCPNRACTQYHMFVRPEEEGALALPHGKFGLDVLALVGQLRFAEQCSMRAIHRSLRAQAVELAPRTVTGLVHRYAALLARPLDDHAHLAHQLRLQDRVVLAMDGVQPEQDQPVLWVLRDVLSGTVFLVRSLVWAQAADLSAMVSEVAAAVPLPITAVICTGPGAGSPQYGEATAVSGPDSEWMRCGATRPAAAPSRERGRQTTSRSQSGLASNLARDRAM